MDQELRAGNRVADVVGMDPGKVVERKGIEVAHKPLTQLTLHYRCSSGTPAATPARCALRMDGDGHPETNARRALACPDDRMIAPDRLETVVLPDRARSSRQCRQLTVHGSYPRVSFFYDP